MAAAAGVPRPRSIATPILMSDAGDEQRHEDADDGAEHPAIDRATPDEFGGQPRRSMMVALAMPPPSHIVCRP